MRITNLRDGAAELLDANVAGTGLSKSYSAGVLRLQGNAPPAIYEKVLRSVTYRNSAVRPDTAVRNVSFVVNDGFADSNTAVSTIRIIYLRLDITVDPESQSIASGGTAVFTVTVRNNGNVSLKRVPLRVDAATDCDRTWNAIAAGASRRISCSATAVSADFLARFTVSGEDDSGNSTNADTTARVEVENPNIRIVKGPSTRTLLPGQDADFSIFVLNPSTRVNLGEVQISDPLVPACSREGANGLGNLAAGAQQTYTCRAANVTAAFTNVITVTGRNLFTGALVSDSSVAAVELLDLRPALQVDPALLGAGGGPVTFALTAVNSGSVPWTLTALLSETYGDLLDTANATVQDNSCAILPRAAVAPDELLSCAFTAIVSGPPGARETVLRLDAEDDAGLLLRREVTASVTISENAVLRTELSGATDSVAAPGRYVRERVVLTNSDAETAVIVEQMQHTLFSNLDGVGTCTLPQTIEPDGRYSCGFEAFVGGSAGDTVEHTLQVRGRSGGTGLSGLASWRYTLYDPELRRDLFPIVASAYAQPVEENDTACSAFPIAGNAPYRFLLDDAEDWYRVKIERAGRMTVDLREFISTDPQLIIYRGPCDNLSDPVGFDGSRRPDKRLEFAVTSGTYLVRVVNSASVAYNAPYTLTVNTP